MGHDGVSDGVESSVDHFTTAAPGQVTSAFPPPEQRQSAGAGMDYEGVFKDRLEALHAEGRYRIFADLEPCIGRGFGLDQRQQHRTLRQPDDGARQPVEITARKRNAQAGRKSRFAPCLAHRQSACGARLGLFAGG